jgi:nucleoside-diphosphate-sugar epimerase
MHHLIIGCGYLGRVVAQQWLGAGHTVSALTRGQGAALHARGIAPIIGDVTQPLLPFPAVDTVLYAVGMDRTTGKSMREVYLGGLANVLHHLPKVRRFIYISSTSVYGQRDGAWVDEAAATDPTEESGQILVACEQLLRQQRPDAIILRFAGIYGPNRVIRRASIERGEVLATDPEHWLNLIHVADGATIVTQAATRGVPGTTYNVADGHPVTRRDFYTTMATFLHAPPPTFQTPTTSDGNNRRISNRTLVAELAPTLRFPTYVEGLRDAITAAS